MLDQYHSTMAKLSAEHPVLGLALSHHQSTRGTPMSFVDKPYLIELYADAANCNDWVIRKAVQTGMSELSVQIALQKAGWQGRIVAYVLPTYSIRDRFVKQRVDPLLRFVPAYRERCPGGMTMGNEKAKKARTGSLKLKKFGAGSMLFLGSNTPGDFVEFSADLLIVDEFDHCDPENLAKAKDRLRESPYPQMIRLGNPTLPNVGISRLYDESDRRRWYMQCGHCGERQPVDWFINVVRRDEGTGQWLPRDHKGWAGAQAHNHVQGNWEGGPDIRPVCRRCTEPFDRVAAGALWVAEGEGSTRGYWMSRLDVLSQRLTDLYLEWLKAQGAPTKLAAFYCSVLGIPFEYSGARLDQSMLEAAAIGDNLDYSGGDQYRRLTVTAGIDVGSVMNLSISVIEAAKGQNGKPDASLPPVRRAVLVQACRTFDEVQDALIRYHVKSCVIDAQPETHKAQELRDYFINNGGAQVWLCRFFPTPRVGALPYGMQLKYRIQEVRVDRTAVFDVSFADIQERRRTFPADVFTVLGWSDQMRAPVRVLNEDKGRIVWHEGSAADHFRLADVYDRIAYDLLQQGGSYSAL